METTVMTCRLCNSAFAETWTAKDAKSGDPLNMALCQGCGLVQQVSLPSDEELKIYYSHHYREDYKSTHKPKLKYVHRAGNVAKDRLGFMERAGIHATDKRLLDIGAGGGEFCYMAEKAGFSVRGIEPHHGYSAFARDNYDVAVETNGIADLKAQEADVVTLFHVFEHLAHPDAVIEKVWSVLADHGHLVIEVPNIHQADASPHNIYFKAHLFYYSRFSLMAAASRYFELICLEDGGNLMMAFRKRTHPLAQAVLPTAAQVATTRMRLAKKGWLEYLFIGGGLAKPVKRVAKVFEEALLKHRTPRETLDAAGMSRRPLRPVHAAIGSAFVTALVIEACS